MAEEGNHSHTCLRHEILSVNMKSSIFVRQGEEHMDMSLYTTSEISHTAYSETGRLLSRATGRSLTQGAV